MESSSVGRTAPAASASPASLSTATVTVSVSLACRESPAAAPAVDSSPVLPMVVASTCTL